MRNVFAHGVTLLTSEWNTDEARPGKFYRTSTAGDTLAHVLADDWIRLNEVLGELTRGNTDPRGGDTP